MRRPVFKFGIGDPVQTPIGAGFITCMAVNYSHKKIYTVQGTETQTDEDNDIWWKEEQLAALEPEAQTNAA